MELLNNLALGLSVAASLGGLAYCFLGVTLGTLVGVLPGIGTMATLAMLLPITYHLEPNFALIMLAGIYYGAAYGGSTASILLNLPGTATSAVTGIDGYPMARKGQAGVALFMTAVASFVGSMFGVVLLSLFSVPLARVALEFGPQEYFSLMFLGLIAAALIGSGRSIRSLAAVTLGLALGLVGIDLNSGVARFAFGMPEFYDGLSLVAVAIGLFGLPEIISSAGRIIKAPMDTKDITLRSMLPSREQWRRSAMPMARGSGIGAFFGALPGTGGVVATFISYATEKKLSKHPEEFGKGAIEGIAAPESANNAAVQAAFIPTLSLGIPGDPVMAIMLGVMMVHGILPGPNVISGSPDLFWGLVMSFVIGNIFLMILNLPLIGIWVRILSIPYHLLFPVIVAFVCIGIYSVNFQVMDIYVLLAFGFFGWGMKALNFEVAPLLLGFVLGPMMEENFRRALVVSNGEIATFLTRPISGVIMGASLLIIAWFTVAGLRRALSRRGGYRDEQNA
ncbi:tripartite tricarboxylate transporter permease [Albibacillus kandeliae]|uniref:tripartite tricarboxylate transporter permease n=1 Tax=Albibacillus kandeliae TaxID=2174228 RepID=UPI000D69E358|nr:tripartite tricarboxylate transporter permease [Albibacillus kandeliae]